MSTWEAAAIAAHDALVAPMRVVRRGWRTSFLDAYRILDKDADMVAPKNWAVSLHASPKASAKARAVAYWPRDVETAIAYLRERHCCGILFEEQPIGFGGAFPHGWVWINNKALPSGTNSWASAFTRMKESRVGGRSFLGPNVYQDGAKLHSSTEAGVPYGAADSIILWAGEIDHIARALGAYRGWNGGDDTDGKGLGHPHGRFFRGEAQ